MHREQAVTWTLYRGQGLALVGHCPGRVGPEPQPAHHDKSEAKPIKIAAFDLNKTLIVSKSGTLHGKESDPTDWKWLYDNVPAKLHSLAKDDYTIVIVSNQGRLTGFDGREAPESVPFKRKMDVVMRELQIPVTVLVACANDIYRKPRPGLWSIIPNMTGSAGCSVDVAKSLVVGDAAGRKADFSDSDVHWAMNMGIAFNTPEVFFGGETPEPLGHKFHPEWYLNNKWLYGGEHDISQLLSKPMLVLVGLPGAGKTTFYRRFLRDHGFIRRDILSYNSRGSFVIAVDELVAQGLPVVIDDINIDVESRSTWVSMSRKHGVAADAVYFTTQTDLCLHNDSVRALGGPRMNLEHRPVYPRLHFLDLLPRFQQPIASEGFHAIHDIPFMWSGTEEELDIWKRFWL